MLGFVVEAVTGKPLGAVLQERLWAPLGMSDTSFALPAAKRARYALALAKDPLTGEANPVIHHATDKTQNWESGGGGTVSTAARLPALCRDAALGRHGSASADILGRGTVALMTADHLPASFNNMIADKMDPAATGYGFGLGFAVRRQNGIAAMAGSAGDYYWSGVYGTYFWVDPKEELSGRVHGRRARPDPPALPPDAAQPRVSGARVRPSPATALPSCSESARFPSWVELLGNGLSNNVHASRAHEDDHGRSAPFKTTMQFAYGEPRELAPGVVRIVANNPSPFTFKGTNTYIVGTAQPGPDRSGPR